MSERFWVNAIGFQVIWWACILYREDAVIVVSFLLTLHLIFHSEPIAEMIIVVALAALGFMIDTALTLSGFFVFSDSLLPPLWLFLLWMGFVATLRQSLAFFSKRFYLGALAGALGGSTTYIAAAKLGAVSLGFSLSQSLLILAAIWLFLFPLLLHVSHRIGEHYVHSGA